MTRAHSTHPQATRIHHREAEPAIHCGKIHIRNGRVLIVPDIVATVRVDPQPISVDLSVVRPKSDKHSPFVLGLDHLHPVKLWHPHLEPHSSGWKDRYKGRTQQVLHRDTTK